MTDLVYLGLIGAFVYMVTQKKLSTQKSLLLGFGLVCVTFTMAMRPAP